MTPKENAQQIWDKIYDEVENCSEYSVNPRHVERICNIMIDEVLKELKCLHESSGHDNSNIDSSAEYWTETKEYISWM